MSATNIVRGKTAPDGVREQVLALCDAVRAMAQANVTEANRVAELAEKITGIMTKAGDEVATLSERVLAACSETEKQITAAQAIVLEAAQSAPKPPPEMALARIARGPLLKMEDLAIKTDPTRPPTREETKS